MANRSGWFWLAGSAVRGGERAELFATVMPDRVHPHHLAVDGQLDRPGDDRDLDRLPRPGPAGPVHDPGEVDLAVVVRGSGDRDAGRRRPGSLLNLRPRACRAAVEPVDLILAQPLRMRRDEHAVVVDLHQSIGHDRLDVLTGEHRPDPIVEPGQADGSTLVDPTRHTRRPRRDTTTWHRVGRLGHLDRGQSALRDREPLSWWAPAAGLVRALGV